MIAFFFVSVEAEISINFARVEDTYMVMHRLHIKKTEQVHAFLVLLNIRKTRSEILIAGS